MPLTREDFTLLSNIIGNIVLLKPENQAMLLNIAWHTAPNLLSQVQVGNGGGMVFAVHAITTGDRYGLIAPGLPAVVALIDAAMNFVGAEQQGALTGIKDRYMGKTTPSTATPPSTPEPKPVTPGELPRASVARTRQHIFISYSSTDRGGFVNNLVDFLQASGYKVWMDAQRNDAEGIIGGTGWKQSIADGIQRASVIVLVMSNEALSSKWVAAEIQRAQQIHTITNDLPIIPLRLRDLNDASAKATHAAFGLGDLQDVKVASDNWQASLLKTLDHHNIPR